MFYCFVLSCPLFSCLFFWLYCLVLSCVVFSCVVLRYLVFSCGCGLVFVLSLSLPFYLHFFLSLRCIYLCLLVSLRSVFIFFYVLPLFSLVFVLVVFVFALSYIFTLFSFSLSIYPPPPPMYTCTPSKYIACSLHIFITHTGISHDSFPARIHLQKTTESLLLRHRKWEHI